MPVAAAGSDRIKCGLAAELTSLVGKYWAGLLAANPEHEMAPLYSSALTAARSVSEALNQWPESELSRVQVDRLLEIALSDSAVAFHYPRRVSKANLVEQPETVALNEGDIDQLVYWGVSLDDQLNIPPLTAGELEGLPLVPDEAERSDYRKAKLNAALVPLFETRKSLVLLQLDNTPNLFKMFLDQILKKVLDQLPQKNWPLLENELLQDQISGLSCRQVEDLLLPTGQRWWNIGRNAIPPRDKHSYSSLASLVLKPHEYTLRYGAELSEGSIVPVLVDNRLKGNLGHKIIECWFTHNVWTGKEVDEAFVRQWLDKELDDIAYQYALPLLAAGKRAEKQNFLETIANALIKLLTHLYQAKVSDVQVEATLSQAADFGELKGTLDLFAQRDNGHWLIIDIKWGSEKRYSSELKESRYLQLATYQQLAKSQGFVDGLAFFILQSAHLLARDHTVFPDAFVVNPDDEAGLPEMVWGQFAKAVEWRLGQLTDGRVEVTYSGEADSGSTPPDGALNVVGIEANELKNNKGNGYKQSFKKIDTWRVLTGRMGE